MKTDISRFQEEVDSWVKQFNSELNNLRTIPVLVDEHSENIDHNYELIQEVKNEITKLRDEMNALRMIQLLHLKSDLKKTV